jgi:eukaryotic-like serine/threonine-protein kinase
MNPERWRQVKRVLDGALALETSGQSRYLEEACLGDPELRDEVESLLRHHEFAGSEFLKQPAVELQESPAAPPQPRLGRRLGVYQILEEVGHGGMGAVYRAARVDGQYQKQVAVKLVRGGFDTSFVLERFRQERQILASLDHPHIARLLDGGTTEDGVPYLVMELIEGQPIDQYCDDHLLNVTQRLQLFRQVCSAVQYAHQRLVIHRDIKPSNILVTSEGNPKLLDFGIAKILDPSTGPETTLLHPLTPGYASPEQIRGEPITTASDVYSLGVVLYQLLTGSTPYSELAPHELAKAICELEPARPSTSALRNPRADTPSQTIRDLPGSTDARKLLVSRGLEYLDSLNQQSSGDASLQEELAAAYEKVGDVLGYPYAANLGDAPGALQSYRKAVQIRESLAGKNPSESMLLGLTSDYMRTANVLESTGNLNGALVEMRKAMPITQRMAAASSNAAVADQLGGSYYFTATLLGQTGDREGELENYQKAIATLEAALQSGSSNLKIRSHLAADYAGMALSLKKKGDLAQAIPLQEKAVHILEDVSQASPNVAPLREYLGEALARLADFRKQHHDAKGALAVYRRSHQIFEDLVASDPKNSLAKANVGFAAIGIADALVALGEPDAAVPSLHDAVTIFQALSPETGNRYVRTGLASSFSGLGAAYSAWAVKEDLPARQSRSRWTEARSWYEKSLAMWNVKAKRGELESDERSEAQTVTADIARCDLALQRPVQRAAR